MRATIAQPNTRTILAGKRNSDPAIVNFRGLYRIEVDGEVYTAVSDGQQIVAVLGEAEGAQPALWAATAVKHLTDPAPIKEKTTLSKLLTLVKLEHTPCTRCKGDGEPLECWQCKGRKGEKCVCPTCGDEHEGECETCEGTGTAVCSCTCGQRLKSWTYGMEDVSFDQTHIDPRIFFKALYGLPGGAVTIERHLDPYKGVRFRGKGWIAVVMPFKV